MSFEEQIMSKDKYSRLFLHKIGAIVFITLQMIFETRAVLKIGEYPFRPIARERKYLMDYN